MRVVRIFVAILLAVVAVEIAGANRARSVTIVERFGPGACCPSRPRRARIGVRAQGWSVQMTSSLSAATGDRIVVAGTSGGGGAAVALLRDQKRSAPSAAESLLVTQVQSGATPVLLLCGADERGLMDAALDAADRVGWASGEDPFSNIRNREERPRVAERSLSVYTMNRAYWESRFYDEKYCTRYLDMLADQRPSRSRRHAPGWWSRSLRSVTRSNSR